MYAREDQANGQISIGLPKKGTLSDGRTVTNYDKLSEDILLAEGWLPFVEEIPEYDQQTQYIVPVNFRVEAAQIVREYAVKDQIKQNSQGDEDYFIDIQTALADITELLLELEETEEGE